MEVLAIPILQRRRLRLRKILSLKSERLSVLLKITCKDMAKQGHRPTSLGSGSRLLTFVLGIGTDTLGVLVGEARSCPKACI